MIKVYKAREVAYTFENRIIISDTSERMNEINRIIADNEKAIKDKERLTDELVQKAYAEAGRIIAKAQEDAEKYIADAVAKAMSDAEKKAAEICAQSKEEGHLNGCNEAKDIINNAGIEAEEIIKSAEREKERILSSLSGEILDLSFTIAEKILDCELDKNSSAVLSLINSAVSKVDDADAKVSISEDEYMKHYAVLSEDNRVAPDEKLKKGEIKLYSKKGIIDVSVNKQLAKAKLAVGVGN